MRGNMVPVIGLEPTAHFQNYVVARVGVEPTRDCSPKLLRLSCLPVPAPSPIRCEISVCQCFHVQNDHKNVENSNLSFVCYCDLRFVDQYHVRLTLEMFCICLCRNIDIVLVCFYVDLQINQSVDTFFLKR